MTATISIKRPIDGKPASVTSIQLDGNPDEENDEDEDGPTPSDKASLFKGVN